MKTIMLDNKKEVSPVLTFFFCFYIAFCFFEPYINNLIGGYGRYIIFLVIICFLFSYKQIRIEWYHISIIMWFFLKVISVFWVSTNHIVQSHFLSQIGMLLLFIIMTIVKFENQFIVRVLNTLLFSSSILAILCLFFSQPYEGVEVRQVLTINGAQMDPNNQAAFLLIGSAISLYLLFNKKNTILFSILYIILSMIIIYAIFLTGSRGGFISLFFIVFVIALLSEKGKSLISKKTVLNTALVIIFALIVFLVAKSFLQQDTFERIFNFTGYSDGSNRIDIWGNTIQIIENSPLFGGGWGAYWGYNENYTAVHNTFLSILSDGGILGFVLFFLPQGFICIYSIKQRRILPLLVLITGLLPSFFIDSINKRFFWNAIIISIMLVNALPEKENKIGGDSIYG